METDDDSNAVVDPQVRAYVYSLISALGGTGADEDGRYVLGDDALACLKDLKRWLKLYDKKLNRLDVARCLAEGNLVNGDLLEILAAWSDEPMENRTKMKIALACLELLADLTWPIEKNDLQMTVNHHRHTPYLQVAQLSYKRSVLTHSTSKILRTIVRIGLPSVAQPMSERTSRDEDIIKLVLYFLRNIAMISTPRNLPIDGDEAEVSRSATISAFNDQDILHLLLTISSTMGEDFNTQDVVVLEVLFHLLKGVDVEKLFMNEKQLHAKHTNELQGLLTKELTFKREYAKNAPTRHNRFGSMIWIKRDEDRVSTVSGQDILLDEARSLDKLDKAKKWNKPRGRRGRGDELSLNDFDMPISLTPSANKHLRTFVEDFLDSAFNPLFSHIRKEIERERDRILDIHPRQFFYLIAWFLEAERMRHKVKLTSRSGKSVVGGGDDGFALIAGVLTQETFIILTRFLRESYDMKQWQDLNAGMRCFTEILLTVQQMAESPLEDDQEIAENIQNRLFYEETTHDLIILILRNYNDQGFGYLDACTELVHVHLRMLERYSKQNSDMQVRSRKRARRKRKTAKEGSSEGGVEDDDGDGESSAEDMAAAHRTSTERKFDFKRFAARFLSQSCTNTFVKFTSYYQELDAEQLKRAHRFFYRVAFKMEMSVMLFRVDIIALFVKMIKGPSGLDTSNPAWKEWDELVRQLIKKLVRKMGKRPELAVEMLFSKTNATAHFLEYGYTKQTVSTKIRAPAELEIKPGMVRDEQIGVAVAALLDQDKHDAVRWVKGALTSAFDERQSWETEAAAQVVEQENSPRNPPGITEKSTPSCPSISIRPDNGERRIAMFKDNKLRLLMKLVGFQRLGDEEDADATWIVPSSVTAAELKQCVDLIKKFENDPPVFDDDKVAADFIRRKQAPKARSSTFGDEDDDADFLENDEEEFLFPAGGPTNRKPDALKELKAKRRRRRRPKGSDDDEVPDEAELEARREKRQKTNLERMRAIKSDLYVHDSDDASDEEKDRMFFDKEAELRREHGKKVLEAMRLGAENGENPLGGGLNRKGRKRKSAGGDITTNDKIVNPSSKSAKRRKSAPPPRKTHRPSLFGHNSDSESTSSSPSNRDPDLVSLPSSDEGEKDTPLTSSPQVAQLSLSSHPNTEPPPLTKDRDGDIAMQDDGDDDEDIPAVRRRPRIGGFVVDSDSE